MLNNLSKKIIVFVLVICMVDFNILYAKQNPFEGEVKEPAAESRVNHSEATIYSKNPYNVYSPINPVPASVDTYEYNKVNNYNIDFNTLELRIKYFSPTYKNIKQSALSSYYMAYYIRGGNDKLQFNANEYSLELIDTYKSMYENYINQRNQLDKNAADYQSRYDVLSAQIRTYKSMHDAIKAQFNKSINSTKLMLGLGRALYNIGNVDNNNQITYARDEIVKNLKSAILSYLELKTYVSILEKQSKLYYDMYSLYKKNYELGVSTANDVLNSFSTYENTKNTMTLTKTTMQSVKEQIANNLGYNLSELDKLEFIEPEVDFEYIYSIDFESDKTRAYTSNSKYYNLSLSDKDKKLPGSTGEMLLHKNQDYISGKVVAEFDDVYNKLRAAILSYESSTYLNTICESNKESNIRKLNNNLVTELEYNGLVLQTLADELQIKSAKYSLIRAVDNYYYGALGHLNIT